MRMSGLPTNATSLMAQIRFWSAREEVLIPPKDTQTLRYHDKSEIKSIMDNPEAKDKMAFTSDRGHILLLDNKRPHKLRQGLRDFELVLYEQKVVFSIWQSSSLFQIMFHTGLFVHVHLNKLGDIERIQFDKTFVGKLQENMTDIILTKHVMIIAYLESKLTFIQFARNVEFSPEFEAFQHFEPKMTHHECLGPLGRRLQRHLVLSSNEQYLLVWWSSSEQEVFPWVPHLNEEDRANVMLFELRASQVPKLMGCIRTHSDPLAFRFFNLDPSSHQSSCVIHYLGQETSRKSEIHLENTFLHPVEGDRLLRRRNPQRISIVSNINCFSFLGNLVVLGSTDGTLLVFDCIHHKLDCQTKCPFIPSLIRIHPDKAVMVVSSDKGLLQCFDIALNPIRMNIHHDDETGSNVLDLSQYFRAQMSLVEMKFCPRRGALGRKACPMSAMAQNYLSLQFFGGPMVLVTIYGGVLSSGCLGPYQIVAQYLKQQQFHQILLLLNQLDWTEKGQSILSCLNATFARLLRIPFTREIETLLEMCLGLFYSPNKPIPIEIMDEYSEQIHDLTRKFFHHLLRHKQLAKSFQLAVDINDYDLFMDLYHAALKLNLKDLAEAALVKARQVFFDHVEAATSESETDESLPPPPPLPTEAEAYQGGPSTRPISLPSPMQLFSSVTTVQVDHGRALTIAETQYQESRSLIPALEESRKFEPEADQDPRESHRLVMATTSSLTPQLNATYARTTAAKRISTNEFRIGNLSDSESIQEASPVPTLNIDLNAEEDIKVVHFGVV